MPSLPQRKVGIVACSGEELPEGTLTRLAALEVLEKLRPAETVTICLPLFLAGGEGDRAFAKFYPTIAVDGCEVRCAAPRYRVAQQQAGCRHPGPRRTARTGDAAPARRRALSQAERATVDAVANAIAAEVDRLMAVRWSRTSGAILELEETGPAVSTAGCACGSGIPVTSVEVNGQTVQLMALEPILDMAYGQGLRVEHGELPPALMATVRVYNQVPPGEEQLYAQAVAIAWQAFCERREAADG